MPRFSEISLDRLSECDERLQKLFMEVIEVFDCRVTCGHRGEYEQNEAYATGKSKLKFPKSKHNAKPSLAVDVVPFPVDWNNIDKFVELSEVVKTKAAELGIDIICGADWKMRDYPHYELA